MTLSPDQLTHFVRLRTDEERQYIERDRADIVLVSANILEHHAAKFCHWLGDLSLPFIVDPMLWKFQVPAWWQNERGQLKNNFHRLARAYTDGTKVQMGRGPVSVGAGQAVEIVL